MTTGHAGKSKRGRAPPFVSSRKRGSRGRNPIERVSPSVRVFGYFLHEQKVTQGPGLKAPNVPGYGGEAPEKFREETCFSPTRPAIRESALHQPDAPAQKHQNRLEAPHAAMRQRTPSALMAGLMVSSLSMAMAEAARPARAVPSRSVPSR